MNTVTSTFPTVSPYTVYYYTSLYLIDLDGSSGYDDAVFFYGLNSPGTDWEDIACYLGPNGNIFEDINFYVDSVKDSYGNKKTPSTITVLGAYVKKRRDIY